MTCKVTLILTVPAAVTASHCVKGQQAESLKIVGGTNDITDMDSPTFAVREIIMNAYNDITKAARTFILFYLTNIPSSQSSAKLPVTRSLGHLSSCHICLEFNMLTNGWTDTQH